jgi:hypothetical protein
VCRPPGPLRRDDYQISTRAPALRPTRVRAVLGRRCGAQPAAEPAYGDATAGQDPRAGEKTLRDASSRATKAFYPVLSLSDLAAAGSISGQTFERATGLTSSRKIPQAASRST